MRETILKELAQKGDLPPLPDTFLKLLKKLKDPNASFAEIAKIIEIDPVLAGKIIKLSNSAYYRAGGKKITTLPIAMVTIGLNQITKLVLSLEITKVFDDSSIIKVIDFWKHSLAVALFTQSLCKKAGMSPDIQDLAYLSGLMHDIGIMIFIYLIPDKYNPFLKKLVEKETTIEKQEIETFGIDHGELGSEFIRSYWGMDDDIVTAVRYHHVPFRGSEKSKLSSQIINLADGICNMNGLGNGVECYSIPFNEGAWENLGFTLNDTEEIVAEVGTAIEQASFLVKK